MRFTLNGLVIAGLLLLLPTISQAQKKTNQDFIELSSNEILNGQVLTYRGKKKYQAVTIIVDNQSTNYLPNQVKSFGFGNNVRFEVNERTGLFWQVLVKGELSLFKDGVAYYVLNSDGEIFTLDDKAKIKKTENVKGRKANRTWKRELAKATQDCKNQLALIQFAKYRDHSLIEYVSSYNDCQGGTSTIYASDRNKYAVRLGLSAGGHTINSTAKPRNRGFLEEAQGTSTNIEFGLATEIFFKNSFENFTFTPGIQYRSISTLMTSTQQKDSGDTQNVFHDIYYTASLISLPLEFKYALNRAHPQYYVKAGAILDFNISTELEAYEELESSPTEIFITSPEIDVLPELYIGYSAGIGCQLKLGNQKLNIEAQYQTALTSTLNPIFKITHQRIGAGIKLFF